MAVAHRADGAVVDFEAGAGGVGPKKRIDGVAIADRVRKVLGMPPLGAPIPGYGPGGKWVGTAPPAPRPADRSDAPPDPSAN